MRACLLLMLCPALAAASPAPTTDECVVWQRELSFARALSDHDAVAFAAHLHPHAAFAVSQPTPIRGREAIAREWAGLIEGRRVRLSWYPTRVTIAGQPDIAYSTGPALFEHVKPNAEPSYSLSRYQSVWHRGSDGVWRVLFDDGTAPAPATAAEVKAFRQGRREECAHGGDAARPG